MDNFFPNNSIINISDAVIQDINTDGNTNFVTIFYTDCANCRPLEQTIRLVVTNRTLIFDEAGNSIPPQTNAFEVRIIR